MLYEYECTKCGHRFEEMHKIENRLVPTTHPCPRCEEYEVFKITGCAGFSVPEGGCGNAANGYATTHGDSENFKAKSSGKPRPYPKHLAGMSEGKKR